MLKLFGALHAAAVAAAGDAVVTDGCELLYREFASSVSRYNSVAELGDSAMGDIEAIATATDTADTVYT